MRKLTKLLSLLLVLCMVLSLAAADGKKREMKRSGIWIIRY